MGNSLENPIKNSTNNNLIQQDGISEYDVKTDIKCDIKADIKGDVKTDFKADNNSKEVLNKAVVGLGTTLIVGGIGYGLYRLGKEGLEVIKKII